LRRSSVPLAAGRTAVLKPIKFAYLEAKAFGPSARKRARQEELATEYLIREALESGVRQGVFHLKDLEMTAALIKPLLQEWYLKRWKYHQRGVSPESYADAVIHFPFMMPRSSKRSLLPCRARHWAHREHAAPE
jgi:hypothetical protein